MKHQHRLDDGGLEIAGIPDACHHDGTGGITQESMSEGVIDFAKQQFFLGNDGFIDIHDLPFLLSHDPLNGTAESPCENIVSQIYRLLDCVDSGHYPHVYLFFSCQMNTCNQAGAEINHAAIDARHIPYMDRT